MLEICIGVGTLILFLSVNVIALITINKDYKSKGDSENE